ncbi:MAG TPA: HAD family phosphatase [Anaerohalosphaeraceae bacterium]|nr:HAD family phosphatase [Anaerohalosphaeraceae bacterium]HOT72801.1 HAD family phosphatase [Anaerohalosphaeraceae bacterium]HPB93200.1 HAD family phosphatase [Anaerohalosphaeraceae bacterium]HQG06002.1 HAD family phosphatase [Anaerohalosphaeraceae bacterium]HQI07583.1 HAD family phosphatase [Anaerohalosphaeraceae bacterium]
MRREQKMLKAVIFDFDGVIADSEFLHYKALNQALEQYGVYVPKKVHWDKYLGYTDLENIQAVSKDYKLNLSPEQIRQLARQKTEFFRQLAGKETAILNGVEAFIDLLKTHRIHRAVCSGALREDIEQMLAGSDLLDAFEVLVTAEDVKKGKPDPEGYLLALQRLNQKQTTPIRPEECVVIEDSHWGLAAAAAAGMHRIAVTNTYPAEQLQSQAEKVVTRLDELSIDDLRLLCQ